MKPVIIMLLGVCLMLALACATGSVPEAGRSACGEFQLTADSLSQGLLSPAEFRDRIKTVQHRGSTAEAAIKDASFRLLRTMTDGDGPGFSKATGDMFAACADAGYDAKGIPRVT